MCLTIKYIDVLEAPPSSLNTPLSESDVVDAIVYHLYAPLTRVVAHNYFALPLVVPFYGQTSS
jgi:hypothetical protein